MDVLADDEWDDECSHCCEYAVDDDRAEMVVMEMEMGMEMVMVMNPEVEYGDGNGSLQRQFVYA